MISAPDIEAIVRQVLAQLGTSVSAGPVNPPADRPSVATVPSSTALLSTTPLSTSPSAPLPLILTERVITEALLRDKLGSARQLVIHPKAVLTPSARDHVRRLELQVTRGGNETGSATGKTRPRWKAIVSAALPQVTAFVRQWTAECPFRSQELVGTPQEATRAAIASITRGEVAGVLVFSSQPDVVACLANRQMAVRAACVTSISQLAGLRGSLGPNLIAVDPTGRGLFELRQLANTYLSGGAPALPATWSN